MNTPMLAAIRCSVLFLVSTAAYAGSAEWNHNPTSGDWNTAANWTPITVPNGPGDIATFGLSNITDVSISVNTEVNAITFSPGSASYTITAPRSLTLTFSGAGIIGDAQSDTIDGTDGGGATFLNASTAGNATILVGFGGETGFADTSSAGNAYIIQFDSAGLNFLDNSTAGNALIIQTDGFAFLGFRGNSTAGNAMIGTGENTSFVGFTDTSSADNATIAGGAEVLFAGSSTAGSASISVFSQEVVFGESSTGGTAQIELGFDINVGWSAVLDVAGHNAPGVAIGSLEDDGTTTANVALGPNNLSVGSNNLSTTFSGVIEDNGLNGSLTKIGKGKLVLSGANTYSGGTAINGGQLMINNTTDSGTGTGPVQVNAGQLGGDGIIAGDVTVGDGNRRQATLSPGESGRKRGTLTIQSTLTFKSDAIYKFNLNSHTAKADSVVCNGVTINSGADFTFSNTAHGMLPIGTVFTVIENISANPIAGTFSNLPDGSIFTANRHTYQVNYDGGDGNDLTLTVVHRR